MLEDQIKNDHCIVKSNQSMLMDQSYRSSGCLQGIDGSVYSRSIMKDVPKSDLKSVRRSSSRPIKRPKFDDELVEAGHKRGLSARKSSDSSSVDIKLKKNVSNKQMSSSLSKKKIKVKSNLVPSDFGRWRPADDLRLITSVQQTCDLQAVHIAVRFSCSFTLKEIQDRWFALLYDPLLSRLSQQAIKSLPADVVNKILNEALWSREEECLLADVDMNGTRDIPYFQQFLDDNVYVFHKNRTAEALQDHWLLLRHYYLLNCQTVKSHVSSGIATSINEMEAKIIDDQIMGDEDEVLKQALSLNDRCTKREIKRLEKEIPQWELLLEKSGIPELAFTSFKHDDLASLQGRILKYFMKKNKLIIGRAAHGHEVDVDLTIEGPSRKISRKQVSIEHEDGRFLLRNIGKLPIYVNGEVISKNGEISIIDNSVIEVYCLKLLFNINPDLQKPHLNQLDVYAEETS
ncbi:microspherule protein 1 isoform X2 [Hydra vulgaris]|uniref:Microspherule protein 1 isoform X2 n=1 Tax=Hydra vulgaris TaxID=6087 RepID=A0ABM4C2H2_HYDVU